MIHTQNALNAVVLTLRPNCSLSWQGNVRVLAAVGLWCGAIGVVFLLLGAWPVLPFVGLELLALAAGFYVTSNKASQQEVLRISAGRVELEVGNRWPKKYWRWQLDEVWGEVTVKRGALQLPVVVLQGRDGRAVSLGGFLNKADREALVTALATTPLRLRRDCLQTELVV